MTVFEMIVYLADYIEKTRTFDDCVYLRSFFYENIKQVNSKKEKFEILRKSMILSYDLLIKDLIDNEKIIDNETILARNYFLNNKICTTM